MRAQLAAIAAALFLTLGPAMAEPMHGIAMHGEPKLPADYASFPYVNPDAPKGGRINYGVQGTFDSLNPFIVMGDGARGQFDIEFGNTVFDTLMARSRDEPFTLYPLLAKTVETDADRTFVEFTLDERAQFSNGDPVTPDDVIFTFELLRDKGRPIYRSWIGVVEKMEIVGERGVRLTFNEKADRESPLLLAMLPILPRGATDAENFARSSLEPLIGSGPYVVDSVRPGEMLVLKRNTDYWAKDHPSKRGFDNYDEIRVNYFRDSNTMFEAFKKGLIDVYLETDPLRWTTGYGFPAAQTGDVVQADIERENPPGMYGFVLNTRRPVFQDRAVRAALGNLFDFEWANQNLFNGAYQRTRSYFDGSPLASAGRPADAAERAFLEPYADRVPPSIMDGSWAPASSDGTGRDRTFLKNGFDALAKAGYKLKDGRMTASDGQPLAFEVMLNGSGGQNLAMAWQRTLAKLGITLSIRSVDSAQYLQRQRTYQFDTMLMTYLGTLSPGVEQQFRWGSAAAKQDGTYNFAGVTDPAVDAMIAQMVGSRDRESFEAAVRAFDRLLLSGAYVVPLYHQPKQWVAHWKHIQRPEVTPIYGMQLPTWWDANADAKNGGRDG